MITNIKKWATVGTLGAILLGGLNLAPASASDIRWGVQLNLGDNCRIVRPFRDDYRYHPVVRFDRDHRDGRFDRDGRDGHFDRDHRR